MATHKSLFSKYFSICVAIILSSIVVLGMVLMAFATLYFKNDKFKLLARNVNQAVNLTLVDYRSNGYEFVDGRVVQGGYTILSSAIDAQIFLVDPNGKTLLCTEKENCNHPFYTLDSSVMDKIKDGKYEEMGKLSGIYKNAFYTVGLPMYTAEGQFLGAVFASTSAESLNNFLIELLKMFLLSALAVLMFSFVIIYFATGRLVKPLQEMVEATESFSKGDFTARVPVESFDEVGRLAMAFNNMATSLTTLESTRRSFIANVSHELKTPMTTIGGFIDGMLDGTIPPEKQRQYLGIVSEEVKRLSRLVRSMLGIARIEAGETTLSLAPVDINDIVCRTVFTFEQAIEEKHLEIRGLDVEKVIVQADSDLIHQVVYNLIDNAVKFVNDGGTIDFSYRIEGGMTYVGVKNSGQGISKEEISRVFDRFYKSDKSRSLDKNGVGLGLYIVRTIVNLHGGEILVRSVEGEYCEFLFTLPTAAQKNSQSLFRKTDKSK